MTCCGIAVDVSQSLQNNEEFIAKLVEALDRSISTKCYIKYFYIVPGAYDVYQPLAHVAELFERIKSLDAKESPLVEGLIKIVNTLSTFSNKLYLFLITDGYQYSDKFKIDKHALESFRNSIKSILGQLSISIIITWLPSRIRIGSREEFGRKLGLAFLDSEFNRSNLTIMISGGREGVVEEGSIKIYVWNITPYTSIENKVLNIVNTVFT